MKNSFKKSAAFFLALSARAVMRRYRPKVVMVTGSVGKTSTKDAVAAVLATRFFVRKSEKSFNSEFGVPFTILGVDNPWRNPLAWLSLLKNAFTLIVLPNHYPNLLVLEVGADHPGDLDRILRVATPDAVVVTLLPEIPVHVEAYASPEAVREEEFSPAYALPPGAPLVVSAHDAHALEMAMRTSARTILYGAEREAQVCTTGFDFYEEEGIVVGMQANVQTADAEGRLIVRGSVGATQILPVAAAVAAAEAFAIKLPEALAALEAYEPPPGRGRLFAGIQGSVLIDDSYNSSPAATEEALVTLRTFPHARRRVAVLGDMLELGRYSVMEHERLGEFAAHAADVLVTVGIRARAFAAAARTVVDTTLQIESFDDARIAAKALKEMVKEGDVVLIKGSQAIRTERITEALLAHASDRTRLVRQEKGWLRRE